MSDKSKIEELSEKYSVPKDLLVYANKRINYERKTQQRLEELARKDELNLEGYQKALGVLIAHSDLPDDYILEWVKQSKHMGIDNSEIKDIAIRAK